MLPDNVPLGEQAVLPLNETKSGSERTKQVAVHTKVPFRCATPCPWRPWLLKCTWDKFTGKNCTQGWETQKALAPAILALYVLTEGEEQEYLFIQQENLLSVLLSTFLNPAVIWPAPRSLRASSLNVFSWAVIAAHSPPFKNTNYLNCIHSEGEKKRVGGWDSSREWCVSNRTEHSQRCSKSASCCCPAEKAAHLQGWSRDAQTSHGINPQKVPLRKSTFHIARVYWNNNFNLNLAEPWRFMSYFQVVMNAIKKNKLITSALKLTTQWVSATGRYEGTQVRKDWEACTRWWHLMAAYGRRPPPPHPVVCRPEHRTVRLGERVSSSYWNQSSLLPKDLSFAWISTHLHLQYLPNISNSCPCNIIT